MIWRSELCGISTFLRFLQWLKADSSICVTWDGIEMLSMPESWNALFSIILISESNGNWTDLIEVVLNAFSDIFF